MKKADKTLIIENTKLKEQINDLQAELCQITKDYAHLVKAYNVVINENRVFREQQLLKKVLTGKKVN